jgi:hypothetical protein
MVANANQSANAPPATQATPVDAGGCNLGFGHCAHNRQRCWLPVVANELIARPSKQR